MIASPHPQQMTAPEYLEWEPLQELRYEYCDGKVFAMSGGTKNHDELAFNLRRSLIDRVEEQGCNMSGSDVKVLVQCGLSYRYPDLSISCDDRDEANDSFYDSQPAVISCPMYMKGVNSFMASSPFILASIALARVLLPVPFDPYLIFNLPGSISISAWMMLLQFFTITFIKLYLKNTVKLSLEYPLF